MFTQKYPKLLITKKLKRSSRIWVELFNYTKHIDKIGFNHKNIKNTKKCGLKQQTIWRPGKYHEELTSSRPYPKLPNFTLRLLSTNDWFHITRTCHSRPEMPWIPWYPKNPTSRIIDLDMFWLLALSCWLISTHISIAAYYVDQLRRTCYYHHGKKKLIIGHSGSRLSALVAKPQTWVGLLIVDICWYSWVWITVPTWTKDDPHSPSIYFWFLFCLNFSPRYEESSLTDQPFAISIAISWGENTKASCCLTFAIWPSQLSIKYIIFLRLKPDLVVNSLIFNDQCVPWSKHVKWGMVNPPLLGIRMLGHQNSTSWPSHLWTSSSHFSYCWLCGFVISPWSQISHKTKWTSVVDIWP